MKLPRILLLLASRVILLNLVSATYISGGIYLYANGEATFDVSSDFPINIQGLTFENNKITGTTSQLISLQEGIWTFELNLEEYDDIFLDIYLPKNLDSINSIQGSDSIIDFENKVITIIDSGKLDFKVSYTLKETHDYSFIFWIILIIFIILIFFIYKKIKSRKERFDYILPIVSDKEQQIIDILMKKPMRQKELRKALGIPKASFSRYMVNLEKKKLIVREGEGKNKIIKLK